MAIPDDFQVIFCLFVFFPLGIFNTVTLDLDLQTQISLSKRWQILWRNFVNVLDACKLLTHMKDTMHSSANIVPPVKPAKRAVRKVMRALSI